MKSIREIIAEKDDEYEYYVKSTADIHDPENFTLVKTALLCYQLRSLEVASYKPLMKDNVDFPRQPNSPVFVLKAVTGLPIPKKAAVQMVAVYSNINAAHLKIQEIGKEDEDEEYPVHNGSIHQKVDNYVAYTDGTKEFDPDPRNNVVKNAQDFAGFRRIADLMKELEAGRKDREENEVRSRDVYETFSTTHMMLEGAIKVPLRKGYYVVETYDGGRQVSATVEGPFDYRPDNMPFRDRVFGFNAETHVVKNLQEGGRTLIELTVDGYEPFIGESQPESRYFEVAVQDMRHRGHTYRTLIRETSLEKARESAVSAIATKHNLPVDALVALETQAGV